MENPKPEIVAVRVAKFHAFTTCSPHFGEYEYEGKAMWLRAAADILGTHDSDNCFVQVIVVEQHGSSWKSTRRIDGKEFIKLFILDVMANAATLMAWVFTRHDGGFKPIAWHRNDSDYETQVSNARVEAEQAYAIEVDNALATWRNDIVQCIEHKDDTNISTVADAFDPDTNQNA